jgi:hypothetical protein
MPYIVRAREQDIDYDLFQHLADVVADAPGMTRVDAVYRLRTSPGLLPMDDLRDATFMCKRINDLGVESFLLRDVAPLPTPMHLNLAQYNVTENPVLVVTGRLELVARTTTSRVDLLGAQLTYPDIFLTDNDVREEIKEKTETSFALDIFSTTSYWKTRIGSVMPITHLLQTLDLAGVDLSKGARFLKSGDGQMPRFRREKDYENYVLWLYQLHFAPRQ